MSRDLLREEAQRGLAALAGAVLTSALVDLHASDDQNRESARSFFTDPASSFGLWCAVLRLEPGEARRTVLAESWQPLPARGRPTRIRGRHPSSIDDDDATPADRPRRRPGGRRPPSRGGAHPWTGLFLTTP